MFDSLRQTFAVPDVNTFNFLFGPFGRKQTLFAAFHAATTPRRRLRSSHAGNHGHSTSTEVVGRKKLRDQRSGWLRLIRIAWMNSPCVTLSRDPEIFQERKNEFVI
jgi:hypothetical protein